MRSSHYTAHIRPTGQWFYAEVMDRNGNVVRSEPCIYLWPFNKAGRAAKVAKRLVREQERARKILDR